jgi:diguanylate cyclase (GGDEF)-like protein/PAS domain S-box-containing protein
MTRTQAPRPPDWRLRLLLQWQRSLPAIWLREFRAMLGDRRRGTRVNVLIGWATISVSATAAVMLLHSLYAEPAISAAAQAGPDAAARAADSLFWLLLLLVGLISAGTYAVLYYGVIRPVEHYRIRIRDRLAQAGEQQHSEINALSFGHQKRTEQLEAAMTDNELLREEKAALLKSKAELERLFRSTYESITDRIIVIDPELRVIELSPATSDLIGLHRSRVIGETFESTVKLFDPFHDNPLEYPIGDLARQVVEAGAAVPKIVHALLLAPHGREERVLVSAAAIFDDAGRVVGASFRIEPDTAIADTKPGGPGARGLQMDRVTGLPRREAFDSRLQELIDLARSREVRHVLMLVGVDRRHEISDTFGHGAVDELMWAVAQIVQAEVGTGTPCYRVTSEFIGVLFPFSEPAAASEAGKRICAAVAARVFAWREARYETTASCGLIVIDSECDGASVLMEQANAAVMQARAQGGNQAWLFTEDERLLQRRRSDREWVSWLMPRLEGTAVHLISQAIQPLVAEDKRLPMFEVFLRVEDDDGVWIAPGAFLQAVERYQYSARVDLWVIKAVLAELGQRPEILQKHACACINLSGASLEHPDFANDVMELIMLSGVPGRHLCFEIDEPYVVSRMSMVSAFMGKVKATGAQFSLDHYKAGGGLDALRELPIQYVKMHESMVRRLDDADASPIDTLFARSFNEMCHARGIVTIAAGIETATAVDALRTAGTDFGQGVFLNKMGPLLT